MTATLFAPKVRYASTFESQFDAMMSWRGELELSYLSEDDTPSVLGGYSDFVIIRVGEHPIGDLLDSLSQDAEHFAGCSTVTMSPARCRNSLTTRRLIAS